jgi:hypothetical protein
MPPFQPSKPSRTLARVIAVLTLLVLASAPALAVTPQELADLHTAGLGDDVLAALIETTGVQGSIDGAAALELRRAGLSDLVIAQAIRRAGPDASRQPEMPSSVAATPPAPMEESNVAVIGGSPDPVPAPVVQPAVVFVPWILAPARHRCRGCDAPTLAGYRGPGRFINTDLRPVNTDLRPLNNGFVAPPAAHDDARSASPRR